MPEAPTAQVVEKPVAGVDFDGPHTDQLTGISHAERDHWLRTGELPKPEAEEGESPAPAAPAEGKPAEEMPAGTDSRAVEREDRSKSGFARLRQQNRSLKEQNSALEARLSALEERLKPQEKAPAAEVPAAAAVDAKPGERSQALKDKLTQIEADFKAGKFESYEAYTDAKIEAFADDRAARFRQEQERAAKETADRTALAKLSENIGKRITAAREAHADFDSVVGFDAAGKPQVGSILDKSVIPTGSVIEGWLLDSEYGAELMYYFGSHRTELKELQDKSPFAQSRELTRLEDKFAAPKSSAEPKPTRAPEPAKELGAGRIPPADQASKAVRDNDFRAFHTARTNEALARARAGRS